MQENRSFDEYFGALRQYWPQNGTLPQVALIEPASAASLDEHPNDWDTSSPSDIQAGAKYTESLITALMAGPNWKDSAMIFTYDEFGGFYGHVSPQPMPSPDGIQPIDLKPATFAMALGNWEPEHAISPGRDFECL